MRIRRKNSSIGDKENASPSSTEAREHEGQSKGFSFRRKKKSPSPAPSSKVESTLSNNSSGALSTSSTIPLFSSLSEMTILHNSVQNSYSQDAIDSLPHKPSNPVSNVMQFALPLQSRMYDEQAHPEKLTNMCEEPIIQESIECVFEHQLKDGLEMNVEEDDESCQDDFGCNQFNGYNDSHFTSGKLVQVGSFSPLEQGTHVNDVAMLYDAAPRPSDVKGRKCASFHCDNCRDGKQPFLGVEPKDWIQYPVMLRPTPNSGTKVIGVRHAGQANYLSKQWWKDLDINNALSADSFCDNCQPLPINNGYESEEESLVIDFESELFQGSLHVRIRNTKSLVLKENQEPNKGYFNGLNRFYQCVVQGRFKKNNIPMIHCHSGQRFAKSLTLPPAYIVKGGTKIVNFFSPRLQVRLNDDKPYILGPLGSLPQVITTRPLTTRGTFQAGASIAAEHIEPRNKNEQIIPSEDNSDDPVKRTRTRKKNFDKLCASNNESETFSTNKVYTFEFLQHLIDFETFELNLGSVLGKQDLSQITNGQPMQIMATYQPQTEAGPDIFQDLWNFELWHKKVLDRIR
ncbi:hypothetical protein CTEN210_09285 [Chaetoceros tenuissimus]|uniref:Domain of unknown function at the cortex 1 domain-containing protein n=1 Tax=Chaetoceros tenuissimus TaxID=426638 RepID=A0AAD3CVT8_9STRA|nr:hypothetical protein CTEN210_09285 [Chaetoceros tenuissimus]